MPSLLAASAFLGRAFFGFDQGIDGLLPGPGADPGIAASQVGFGNVKVERGLAQGLVLRLFANTICLDVSASLECRLERFRDVLLSVPPKYSVSSVMGFIKGKSAIHLARVYAGRRRNFVGQHFWARGYWVSTVGKEEAVVRRHIQEQAKEDKRLEQLELAAL